MSFPIPQTQALQLGALLAGSRQIALISLADVGPELSKPFFETDKQTSPKGEGVCLFQTIASTLRCLGD